MPVCLGRIHLGQQLDEIRAVAQRALAIRGVAQPFSVSGLFERAHLQVAQRGRPVLRWGARVMGGPQPEGGRYRGLTVRAARR